VSLVRIVHLEEDLTAGKMS
jgi:hypothetical protein